MMESVFSKSFDGATGCAMGVPTTLRHRHGSGSNLRAGAKSSHTGLQPERSYPSEDTYPQLNKIYQIPPFGIGFGSLRPGRRHPTMRISGRT